MTRIKVFSDGGARGNPGPAAAGFVIKDNAGLTVYKQGRYLGINTNNVAEYQALIDGLNQCLEIAKQRIISEIDVFVDSQLVAQQLTGAFKVKDSKLKLLFAKVKELESSLPKINYHQVPRNQNKEADFLVNKTLNLQHGV